MSLLGELVIGAVLAAGVFYLLTNVRFGDKNKEDDK